MIALIALIALIVLIAFIALVALIALISQISIGLVYSLHFVAMWFLFGCYMLLGGCYVVDRWLSGGF